MLRHARSTGNGPAHRRWLLLFCAVGMTGMHCPRVQAMQVAQETGVQDVDSAWLRAIVINESIPLDLRVGAARRMAGSENSDIVESFAELVRTADDPRLQVIAAGVREAQSMPTMAIPSVIAHACSVGALRGEHMVILRIGGEASIDALRQAVLEGEATCRSIAIRALGSMKSRLAVESLVQLLDVIEPDSEDFTSLDLALQAYAEGNGGRSAQRWREWWANLEPSTSGQSKELLEARLAETIARAEQAEQRALQLAKRLAASLERLLSSMADADREARIVELMRDEESLIRLGAVEQIGQMLRNGRTPSDELRSGMVVLLDDTDPKIRISAAQLLDFMGMDDLGPHLASAIEDETDPSVLVAVFKILGNRPAPGIVPLAVGYIMNRDPMVSDAAAGAITAVGKAGLLDEDMRFHVMQGLAEREGGIDSQALATVAVIGSENEDLAMELLASESDDVRHGAADGLHARGARERLLEVSDDPLIARVAVQAWSDPPVSLDSIHALLQLEPAEELTADTVQWNKAVNDVLASLPPDSVVEADDLLAQRPEFFETRREALRSAATTLEVDEAIRFAAARRLSDRLVEKELHMDAAAELRAAGATPTSPLGDALFTALLLGKSWDEAALIRPSPDAWLGVLQSQLDTRPELSESLIVVIEERFGPELTPEQRRVLDKARQIASPAAGDSASVKTASGEARVEEPTSDPR